MDWNSPSDSSELYEKYEARQRHLLGEIDRLRALLNRSGDDQASVRADLDFWRAEYFRAKDQITALEKVVRGKDELIGRIRELACRP